MELQINSNCKDPKRLEKFGILFTPPIDENYWLFRVQVSDDQAVVGFPKFTTIGIGFQHEENWNTNLPYQCESKKIFDHIACNKGDKTIPDNTCIEAIQLIKDAATKFMEIIKT